MNIRTEPREQRNGGTFLTKESAALLIDRLRARDAELLDRLGGQ